jgi:hypothetical protein
VRVFARGQGEGEEVFAAVDGEGRGSGGGGSRRPLTGGWRGPNGGWRSEARRIGLAQQFGVPPRGESAVVEEERLVAGGGGEFAQLRPGELEKSGRLPGTAPALQQGEHRQGLGGSYRLRRELDPDGHGVARDGRDEIGWKVEAEHAMTDGGKGTNREGFWRRFRKNPKKILRRIASPEPRDGRMEM